MICHSIAPYTPPPKPDRGVFLQKYQGGDFGSLDHLRFIHQRALALCKFTEGEKVKYRNKVAKIEEICDDFDQVLWEDMTCLYILISMDNDTSYDVVHHSMLKRMGR